MWWSIFGSPERDRLVAAIAGTRIELRLQLDSLGAKASIPWAKAADGYLIRAENCLRSCDLQHGWVNVLSAQRTMLANSVDFKMARRTAARLRREMEKATGWRARAIIDLICDKEGKLRNIESQSEIIRVADAVGLRDDLHTTTYFKIALRRRHLVNLFLLLLCAILGCLLTWPVDLLPNRGDRLGLATIIFTGMLGAGVSVALSLMSTDAAQKIPAQQIGSFLVWMRPAIGAATALAATALLGAGKAFNVFSADLVNNSAAVLTVAFAAGFSERFITSAIERIAERTNKTD
jgi:hypothetical protein